MYGAAACPTDCFISDAPPATSRRSGRRNDSSTTRAAAHRSEPGSRAIITLVSHAARTRPGLSYFFPPRNPKFVRAKKPGGGAGPPEGEIFGETAGTEDGETHGEVLRARVRARGFLGAARPSRGARGGARWAFDAGAASQAGDGGGMRAQLRRHETPDVEWPSSLGPAGATYADLYADDADGRRDAHIAEDVITVYVEHRVPMEPPSEAPAPPPQPAQADETRAAAAEAERAGELSRRSRR